MLSIKMQYFTKLSVRRSQQPQTQQPFNQQMGVLNLHTNVIHKQFLLSTFLSTVQQHKH